MLDGGFKFYAIAVKASLAAVVVAFIYGLVTFYLFGGRFLGLEEAPIVASQIDVVTGDTVTPDKLMGWLRIERDAPLFAGRRFAANDLRSSHRLVSDNNPTLATLSISREFSGKVVIRATERIPIARIGSGGLAVDRDGNIFAFRKTGMESLVSIEGALPSSLEAGNRIVPSSLDTPTHSLQGRSIPSAMGIAALRLIDFLSEGNAPIPLSAIRAVNTDKSDYVKIFFKDGRTARLAWDCMKSSVALDGRDYLAAQISGLAGAMASREGRSHRDFDFTIKGRGYGL